MNYRKHLVFLLSAVLLAGCGTSEKEAVSTSAPAESVPAETAVSTELEVHSDSLHDGVWDSSVTSLSDGENHSPSLSWNAYPEAQEYAVYMLDETASSWMHWKQTGITAVTLAEGSADSSQYKGPYPPSGTHTYTVYVYALKQAPDSVPGVLDASGVTEEQIRSELDTAGGASGNVLAEASISGNVSAQ